MRPKAPPVRREWSASTKEKWRAFWRSDAALVLAPAVDAPGLERLFDLYDERERAYQDFRKQRFVIGSQGQQVLNPLGRLVAVFDAEIRQLEDRLGFSPASRVRLGLELAAPDEPQAARKKGSRTTKADPRATKRSAGP